MTASNILDVTKGSIHKLWEYGIRKIVLRCFNRNEGESRGIKGDIFVKS
jgi:hypothetical protein